MTLEEDTKYPLIDLYDHEILALESVLAKLSEKQRTAQNLEAFRKEIVERCAEVGIVVYAKVFETNQEGVFAFEVEIRGRTEAVNWDPDQQVHEVVNDILDILPNEEKGQTIKTKAMRPGQAPGHHH